MQHFSAEPAVPHIWLWSVADVLSELDRYHLSALFVTLDLLLLPGLAQFSSLEIFYSISQESLEK